MRQVHGADVDGRRATPGARPARGATRWSPTAPGVALLARAADCVPVLLPATTGVVAAVHSGRPGLAAGVVPAAVARMRDLGAPHLTAWVGPHVCGACYEVPEEMRDEVAAVVPAARSTTSWGTPALDLGAGVLAQLADAGVADVRWSTAAPARTTRGRPTAATAGPPPGSPGSSGGRSEPRRRRPRRSRRGPATDRGRLPQAGRDPGEVTLVVVTKFFPAADVRLLADLGVTHVGENRHQEAVAKAAECADLGLTWHFIGGLQSNKAAAVAAYADVVESVDRRQAPRRAAARRPRPRPRPRRPAPGQPRPAGGRRPVRRRPCPAGRPRGRGSPSTARCGCAD